MNLATVTSWIKSEELEDKRIKTKRAAELLIKHQLGALGNLIREFGLKITITLVLSQKNKADMLTRVKKAWLQKKDTASVCCVGKNLKDLHNMHHFVKERILYLARKVNPNIKMEAVKEMVEQCKECQSIDPASFMHEKEELHVVENWKQLAIDITHYRHELYLSMIDCGSGKVVIWRRIRTETVKEIELLRRCFWRGG